MGSFGGREGEGKRERDCWGWEQGIWGKVQLQKVIFGGEEVRGTLLRMGGHGGEVEDNS